MSASPAAALRWLVAANDAAASHRIAGRPYQSESGSSSTGCARSGCAAAQATASWRMRASADSRAAYSRRTWLSRSVLVAGSAVSVIVAEFTRTYVRIQVRLLGTDSFSEANPNASAARRVHATLSDATYWRCLRGSALDGGRQFHGAGYACQPAAKPQWTETEGMANEVLPSQTPIALTVTCTHPAGSSGPSGISPLAAKILDLLSVTAWLPAALLMANTYLLAGMYLVRTPGSDPTAENLKHVVAALDSKALGVLVSVLLGIVL